MGENVCKVGKRFDNKPFAVAGKVLWQLSTLWAGPITILDCILVKSPLIWVIVHLAQPQVAKNGWWCFFLSVKFSDFILALLAGGYKLKICTFLKTEVKKVSGKNWLNHFFFQILIIIVSYFLTNWDVLPSSADRHFWATFRNLQKGFFISLFESLLFFMCGPNWTQVCSHG